MPRKSQARRAPENTALPPLYKAVIPLFRESNRNLKLMQKKEYSFAARATHIALTTNEFAAAGRDYPILFDQGGARAPVALTGAHGGRNQFVSASGEWKRDAYIPLYARQYPFILVKDGSEAERMALCVDPTSKQLVQAANGGNLFDGCEPSCRAKAILQFCELYEAAAAATADFVRLLWSHDLLIEAPSDSRFAGLDEAALNPYLIVSEEKLRTRTAAETLTLSRAGAIAFIHAHLFSLRNVRKLLAPHPLQREVDNVETNRKRTA